MQVKDSLIAATALVHNLAVTTLNPGRCQAKIREGKPLLARGGRSTKPTPGSSRPSATPPRSSEPETAPHLSQEKVSHPVSHSWVGDRRLAVSPPESSESSPVATALPADPPESGTLVGALSHRQGFAYTYGGNDERPSPATGSTRAKASSRRDSSSIPHRPALGRVNPALTSSANFAPFILRSAGISKAPGGAMRK